MKFKNFCVIVIDNIVNAKRELSEVSETELRCIESKGILIATISSALTVGEITEYLKSYNRTFFIFELKENTYGINLNKPEFDKHLLSIITEMNDNVLKSMGDNLMNHIIETSDRVIASSQTKTNVFQVNKTKKHMLDVNHEDILNEILDKGCDMLTDDDKIVLDAIRKKIYN